MCRPLWMRMGRGCPEADLARTRQRRCNAGAARGRSGSDRSVAKSAVMILVAGGQLDFNIGALLRRMLQRRVRFKEVLVGPGKPPRLTIDLDKDRLVLDGRAIRPTACFMRHDVFLAQAGGAGAQEANAAALNWYAAIKGWELAHDDVRGFNKNSIGADSNKLANLYAARRCGLTVPPTVLT